jgi:hypothetical protein
MNIGTTGLITVIDENGVPVLFKVFPKHELLLEQEPVVNAESTAVAYMYLNPFLAAYNDPLQAAVILELLRQTEATPALAKAIETSFADRNACIDHDIIAELAAKGINEILAFGDTQPVNYDSYERQGQADQNDLFFFDRDGSEADKTSLSGFTFNPETDEITVDYVNNRCKWWMVTLDSASAAPDYTPVYSDPSTAVGFIPPKTFTLPSMTSVIENTIGAIIGTISANKMDFWNELIAKNKIDVTPATGSLNFQCFNSQDTYELGCYSVGLNMDLTDLDRYGRPFALNIICQLIIPVLNVAFDVSPNSPEDTMAQLINNDEFAQFLSKLKPDFQKFITHLGNADPASFDDAMIIAVKLVNNATVWPFICDTIFDGQLPSTIPNKLITWVLDWACAAEVVKKVGVFVWSFIDFYTVTSFDNYVIDLTKYCSTDDNNSYNSPGISAVPFGESIESMVCNPNDPEDWCTFTADANLTGSLDIEVTNKTGGIWMALYKKDEITGKPGPKLDDIVADSPGFNASLNVSPLDLTEGEYYVRLLYMPTGAGARRYKFTNNCYGGNCQPDTNNSYLDAIDIPFGSDSGTRIVCNPDDKADWYKFTSTGNITGTVDLSVTNGTGSADITLYNSSQAPNPDGPYLKWSVANPTVSIDLAKLSLGPGTYYVRIRHIGSDYLVREYKFENKGNDGTSGNGWAHTWGGPDFDSGYGVTTDSSGNVYVTGGFSGTDVNFNPGGSDIHSSNGQSDVFISKFNSSGTLQWVHTWGGPSVDEGFSVATDGSGNVYVMGTFIGADVNFNPDGSDIHSSNGESDVFISKFNASGNFQWARTWGGTDFDYGSGIAVDSSANVFVTGYFYGTDVNLNPDGSDIHSSIGDTDVFFSKFNSNGDFQWAYTWGGTDCDCGYSVATGSSGIVYVAGKFRGKDVNLNPQGTDLHSSNGGCEIYFSKFDTNGNFQWARSWGGPKYDFSYGVAADSSGNAYLTGQFQDININFNPGGSDLYFSNGSADVFLSKFNPSGDFQWARTWGGTGYDEGRSVAVDSSGNVYVTGSFEGANINFDPGGFNIHSSNGSSDFFISKFNSSGDFQWARTLGGTNLDQGRGVTTDISGNAYVTGYFYGVNVNFNPGGLDLHSSNGEGDVFLSKFLPNGYW